MLLADVVESTYLPSMCSICKEAVCTACLGCECNGIECEFISSSGELEVKVVSKKLGRRRMGLN